MKKVLKILLILFLITGCKQKEFQSHNFFYMDTYINIKIYGSDNYDKEFKEIEKIYKEYHELSDRYHEYDSLENVYYINNNKDKKETIKLNQKLCDIIELGIYYANKTDNKFNINMAKILDVWAEYRETKNGIPRIEELEESKNEINQIIFKDKCEILNNNPSIDLGAIAKGYATQKVGEYLKSKNINEFIINAGGNVLVGNHYNNLKYKIGLETPDQSKKIYKVLNIENKAVVTSGGYERFYIYDNQIYHHIIDYNTLYPANNFKSVTVISSDSGLADTLSTCLFLLSIEDGKKLIDNLDVDAIWYLSDGSIITTEGISKYE